MSIFKCFILSHFNFCPVAWHYCNKSSTKKMERVQERALRFVYDDFKSSYSELLHRSSLDTLELGRVKSIATQTFKILQNLAPSYLSDLVKARNKTHSLRKGLNTLHIPQVKNKKFGQNSFYFMAPKIWNSLPNNIRISTSLSQFKALVKVWEGLDDLCRCSLCRCHN